MLAEVGLIATLTPDAATLTVALAVFVESTLLVVVTVCVPVVAGAVYSPLVLIVPDVELPPETPSTDHCTLMLVVPETVAANCLVPFTVTVAEVGLMATATVVTVTDELALLVVSALLMMLTK
jgi:hypothetical protein